jgi:hypothetical protein
LNFFADFFTAMNSPPTLFRLVDVFVRGFFNCVRFFTAPLRALSPTGLFTAIVASCFTDNAWQECFVPIQEPAKRFGVITPQDGGLRHGFWSRRFIVSGRRPVADHSASCDLYASLGRMHHGEKGLSVFRGPFLFFGKVRRFSSAIRGSCFQQLNVSD